MHVSGIPVDLYSVLQFVGTAVLIALGLLHLVKSTASKYFVVDASFDEGGEPAAAVSDAEGRRKSQDQMRAAAAGGGGCAVCGNSASKKCSGCKAVRYCSENCQSRHWKAGHKLKCKELKLFALNSGQNLVRHEGNTELRQIKKVLFPYEEFVKLFNLERQGFPPCGLLNCGNSCFANVVLQCLSCTWPLIAYLLEKDHRRECRRNDWCFLCELQTHVQRARQSLQPFSPLNILSRLPNIGGNLGYGKQEDAHEFMRFAIDTMQSVCLDEFGGEKSLHPSSQETTIVQYIFGGHLQSQVTCSKCNKISYRYENMMDLTVEIQGDAASLEDCLDQFTAQEWLDGENMYKCDGCNDYVKACKRLTICQAPNVLTIALKRFQSGRFGKLNKRVTFPETLDLCPYMSEPGGRNDLYRLYAVVVHIDMLNASFFGHYICYTKDFDGNWYRIDDYKVAPVELEEVLSQGAYMLLYSRTSARPSYVKPLETLREEQEPMEVIREDQPCLIANYEQNNPISCQEIMPSGMALPTGEPCYRKEDSEDMDLDDPIRFKLISDREYQQDQDLSNPELRPLGSKDLDTDSEHSHAEKSVVTPHVVERGLPSLYSSSEATLSSQVDNMEPEVSGADSDVGCSFEKGDWTRGNFNKKIVRSELRDDCLLISSSNIHEMAEKPRSSDPVEGGLKPIKRIAHEANEASFQSLPNPRLELADTVELVKKFPAARDREVKTSTVDAGSPHSRAKLTPLFTPGFLDKSTKCKSLHINGKVQVGSHEVGQSCNVASNFNESTKPGSPYQGSIEVDDSLGTLELDCQGRQRLIDKPLRKCLNGDKMTGKRHLDDCSFDDLHAAEVASPAELACKVVYGSPSLSESSSADTFSLKHETWGRQVEGSENGVELYDLKTPVLLSCQNGSHEMEALFSVPVAASRVLDESSNPPISRLDQQVASVKYSSDYPAARTTGAKSSNVSEQHSSSREEIVKLSSTIFVDRQIVQTCQNGNGSYMKICEDGPVHQFNECNGYAKPDFLHQICENVCQTGQPDRIFLDHNGQSTSGFIENQHKNCLDEDNRGTSVVKGETGKKLVHCNGNAASIFDEDKEICNVNSGTGTSWGNDESLLFSPDLHNKSIKKKSGEKDVDKADM